jgi:hypothetical protein
LRISLADLVAHASPDEVLGMDNGWRYTVELPNARHVRPKAYADNFAFNRVGRWTH